MAHELEERDGKTSFFQVVAREISTAWHRLGEITFGTENCPKSVADAVALVRGDFEVEVRPQTFTVYTESGDSFQKESTLSAALVRADLQTEIGTASPKYVPMTYQDALRPLDPFIQQGLLEVFTAGVMRGGRNFFMSLRWNKEKFGELFREACGDTMQPYVLASLSHSGGGGSDFYDTLVNTVCANTERMAISAASGYFKVKHSNVAATRLVTGAEKQWGAIIAKHEALGRDILALKALTLDEATFRKAVLDVIAPKAEMAKDFNPKGRFANALVKRSDEARDLLEKLWVGGVGHVGNGSAWEAYQAVTEAADHSAALWRPRSDESRFDGLIKGPMVTLKGQAWDSLLALTV